jgi:methylthioribose-1-phosphate isomerase
VKLIAKKGEHGIMQSNDQQLQSVIWDHQKQQLHILDQRLLPDQVSYLQLKQPNEVWEAIQQLKVRGAPAIGIVAAFGLYIGFSEMSGNTEQLLSAIRQQRDYLASARPTAVNLSWALNRMVQRAETLLTGQATVDSMKAALLEEARAIYAEDVATNRAIGEYALTLLEDGQGILTHCNAGSLATARYGTATAPLYLAKERGWQLRVYADETRPVLQGARLTAFELMRAGIDVTLITDSMAGMVMSKGWVQAVIVGTDRVAANGDVANKIGTYSVALLARAHRIPFYVACPVSTIDLNTKTGTDIPIEERHESEVTEGFGRRTAPVGIKVYNPAFDITPHEYVTAMITERGIIRPPFAENLTAIMTKH